ncbi:MAG: hypothetical protein RL745_504 [Actinomycetota bacterium]
MGVPVTDVADPGLFGPGSATWIINADATAIVGGIRALLLQALHPSAMAAVDRLSDYRRNTWARLLRTAEYIGMTCFGTTEEAHRTAAHVRLIHERLGINDVGELLWVHAALVDSVADAYLRTHPSSEPHIADTYLAEQVDAAELVDIPRDQVFASTRELDAYLAAIRPKLAVTAPAMTAMRSLIVPYMPWPIRFLTPAMPLWKYLAGTSFMCLPLWVQAEYAENFHHLPPSARRWLRSLMHGSDDFRGRRASRRIRLIRATMMAMPAVLRIGPHVTAAYARLGMRAKDHH